MLYTNIAYHYSKMLYPTEDKYYSTGSTHNRYAWIWIVYMTLR